MRTRFKPVTLRRAADTIFGFIQTTQSGALGIVAVLFLLWTTILMLTRVEETFNDIWGVTQGRNWLSRIVLYWAAMTLGTMLIMAAIGLASGPYFEKTRSLLGIVPYLETLVSTLLPVVIICVTFTLFYKLVPNTRVNFGAAFVGGDWLEQPGTSSMSLAFNSPLAVSRPANSTAVSH